MINTSSEYKNSILEDREFILGATITLVDNTVLTVDNRNIMSNGMKFEDGVSATGTFSIGAAIINQHTLILDNSTSIYSTYDFTGAVIRPTVGLKLSATTEVLNKGVYTVDSADAVGKTIVLTALDNMNKFDCPFSEVDIEFPVTSLLLLQAVSNHCGVSLATTTFLNNNFNIATRPVDEAMTCREIVAWIAQLSGNFARVNTTGALELKWYKTDVSHNITTISSSKIGNDDVVITGIQVAAVLEKIEGETETTEVVLFGSNGYVLSIVGNPLIQGGTAATVANSIGAAIVGMSFRPLTLSALSDPSIEAGDSASVTDARGSYQTLITNLTYTVGNFESFTCDAKTPSENSSTRYSAETKAIVEARENTIQRIDSYNLSVQRLTNLISNSFGMYKTEDKQVDGSSIFYLHDKPTLAESMKVWKQTIDAFAVSTDGGVTWNAGFDAEGNATVNVLDAIGINADWITTGKLQSNNNSSWIDMTDGTFNLGNKISFDGSSLDITLNSGVEVETAIDTAQTEAISAAAIDATTKANAAKAVANTAQSTANTATTNAATAQTAANAAQTTANGAITRITTAESTISQHTTDITARVTSTTYTAGMATKESAIYKQAAAPAHLANRLWLETDVTPNILWISNGTVWTKATATTAAEVGAYSTTDGSALATRVTTAETKITADAIVSTVRASSSYAGDLAAKTTSSSIISTINQTAEAITINAAKLNLTGYVTVSSLGSGGTTTIDGARITTGILKSSNYVYGSTGTSINLTTGAIDTKAFKVSSTGAVTASNISITGGSLTTTYDANNYTTITGGHIINQGLDGTGVTASYKEAWIHNGALDCTRVDDSSLKYRTVITSDIIFMYGATGTTMPFAVNGYENWARFDVPLTCNSNITTTGVITSAGSVCTGWTNADGGIYIGGRTVMRNTAADSWVRTYGECGWFNGDYGLGMYIDAARGRANCVSTYNNAHLWVNGQCIAENDLYIRSGNAYINNTTGNYHCHIIGTTNGMTMTTIHEGQAWVATEFGFDSVGGRYFRPADGYDAAIRLGTGSRRWQDLYVATGVVSSSDRKLKKDIVDIENASNLILSLEPKQYKFIDGTSNRNHYGFIAQDVERIMGEVGISDCALLIKDVKTITDEDGEVFPISPSIFEATDEQLDYSLRYEEFIAPIVMTIQKQNDLIIALQDRLNILESERV